MEYWVDGYNVILRQGWEASMSLQLARERLVRELVPLRTGVRVFFDARSFGSGGPKLASPDSKIEILFVRSITADDAMLRDLARHHAPKSVTLVTDDRELKGRARQLGANTLGVAKLVDRLRKNAQPKPTRRRSSASPPSSGKDSGKGKGKDRKLNSNEVEDWVNWFGFDEFDPNEPQEPKLD